MEWRHLWLEEIKKIADKAQKTFNEVLECSAWCGTHFRQEDRAAYIEVRNNNFYMTIEVKHSEDSHGRVVVTCRREKFMQPYTTITTELGGYVHLPDIGLVYDRLNVNNMLTYLKEIEDVKRNQF